MWEKFRTDTGGSEPYQLFFPPYSKETVLAILCLDCPSGEDVAFFRQFVGLIYDVYCGVCQDLSELRHLVNLLFPQYVAPVKRGEVRSPGPLHPSPFPPCTYVFRSSHLHHQSDVCGLVCMLSDPPYPICTPPRLPRATRACSTGGSCRTCRSRAPSSTFGRCRRWSGRPPTPTARAATGMAQLPPRPHSVCATTWSCPMTPSFCCWQPFLPRTTPCPVTSACLLGYALGWAACAHV